MVDSYSFLPQDPCPYPYPSTGTTGKTEYLTAVHHLDLLPAWHFSFGSGQPPLLLSASCCQSWLVLQQEQPATYFYAFGHTFSHPTRPWPPSAHQVGGVDL